jgi:hypothetical protein
MHAGLGEAKTPVGAAVGLGRGRALTKKLQRMTISDPNRARDNALRVDISILAAVNPLSTVIGKGGLARNLLSIRGTFLAASINGRLKKLVSVGFCCIRRQERVPH